jgi:predicted lipid-binding transport protein (Tim44 family)
MGQLLGDEVEEDRRKDELRSIFSATIYGFVLGGLIGGVFGGYGGFLVGLFGGSMLLSIFAVLGAKAIRREKDRQRRRQEGSAPNPVSGLPRRTNRRA